MKKDQTRVVCRNCIHYFITHDSDAPYGCKAFGFKSKKTPAHVVCESSGMLCQSYSAVKKTITGGDGSSIIA